MKYLKIQNNGELDVRLISLLGGTTKANDSYKIGRFGTGLKYVLAYLFRNNIGLRIFVGEKEIKLHTQKETIQNTEFEIVYIDDQRTSITTQMGTDWQAWMIVREIWCNALDEGAAFKDETNNVFWETGKTTFYIQITSEIKEVLDNWKNYFVHDEIPIYECDDFAIYPAGKDLQLYKQGVLIHTEIEAHPLFKYDIKNASINELREYRGNASSDILNAWMQADEKTIDYILNNLTEQHWEGGKMDYAWSYVKYSERWENVIGNAKLIHQKAVDAIKSRGGDIDITDAIVVPKNLFVSLTKQFKGISILRVIDKIHEFYEIHDEKLIQMVKEAQVILEECGYFISPELKFIFGVFGDKTKLAQINFDSKEICISAACVNRSLFDMCSTIIEENEHFNTGHADCTRAFQQHFIDLFTKTLLEKNEVKL